MVWVVADAARVAALVCQLDQTHLDSTQLDVWSCLDGPLPDDGSRRLADLAKGWTDIRPDTTLLVAVVPECHMVGTVLSTAFSRSGLR